MFLSRSAPLWLGSAPSREDSRFGNVRERMPSDILRPSGKLQPRGKLGHIVFSGRNLIFCCSNPIKRGGVQGLPGFGLECSFIDSRYRAGRFGSSAGSGVTTKYELLPPYRANRWQYTGDRSLSRLVCGLPRGTAAAR